jgi:hypothetical protein
MEFITRMGATVGILPSSGNGDFTDLMPLKRPSVNGLHCRDFDIPAIWPVPSISLIKRQSNGLSQTVPVKLPSANRLHCADQLERTHPCLN